MTQTYVHISHVHIHVHMKAIRDPKPKSGETYLWFSLLSGRPGASGARSELRAGGRAGRPSGMTRQCGLLALKRLPAESPTRLRDPGVPQRTLPCAQGCAPQLGRQRGLIAAGV